MVSAGGGRRACCPSAEGHFTRKVGGGHQRRPREGVTMKPFFLGADASRVRAVSELEELVSGTRLAARTVAF